MGQINYNNRPLNVPEVVNGRSLRNIFRIPKNRTMYSTDENGRSKVIGDTDVLKTRNNPVEIGDLPYTEKG